VKHWEEWILKEKISFLNDRIADPYVDRRSGDDRRAVYDSDYFENGGLERRQKKDRRQPSERRQGCVRVSNWSSVCPEEM
jgi:hypothetical protein